MEIFKPVWKKTRFFWFFLVFNSVPVKKGPKKPIPKIGLQVHKKNTKKHVFLIEVLGHVFLKRPKFTKKPVFSGFSEGDFKNHVFSTFWHFWNRFFQCFLVEISYFYDILIGVFWWFVNNPFQLINYKPKSTFF